MTRHVLAAAAQQVGASWRFAKPRRSGAKIDGVIALAMAHSVLIAERQKTPMVPLVGMAPR